MQHIAGTIVTDNEKFRGTISFNENTGLITEVTNDARPEAILFDDTCLIFPGFGDIHIHAREDISGEHCYKEDFASASAAAINGGVTHLADMPNNPIPPVNTETYSGKRKLADKSPIHITLYAGIGPGTSPLHNPVPYKVFMGPSIGKLYFESNVKLEETISRYAGQNVSFHCEDPDVLTMSKQADSHEDRRPVEAELLATDFALYLIEKYKLRGKLCHYSSGEGLQKIIAAKKKDVQVTCEVTPTHLFFDRSVLTKANHKWFQMNPPLRTPADREAMLRGVIEGHIDYLATDHAPHTMEEKQRGISGISQLDTYSLFVTYLIKTLGVDVFTIVRICATNPGNFVNEYLPEKYGKGFGHLKPGYAANFTVLNLEKPLQFQREMVKSKSGWSPFEGFTFPGSVEAVYFMGKRLR